MKKRTTGPVERKAKAKQAGVRDVSGSAKTTLDRLIDIADAIGSENERRQLVQLLKTGAIKEANRDKASRKPRNKDRDEWIRKQLSHAPRAKPSDLWSRAPDSVKQVSEFERFSKRVRKIKKDSSQ